MYFYCIGNKQQYLIKRNFYYIGNRDLQSEKINFYYTGNRDIGLKNLMSLLLFGLKNGLLQIMDCSDIVAATVLQMWKFIEYRYRNKALYDFRQECLSENFTEIVIRKNRQLVSITHD